jgi:predicted outer membrane protein
MGRILKSLSFSVTVSVLILGLFLNPQVWAVDDVQKILSSLHHSNQYEIRLGKIAKKKSISRKVQEYAENLIKDHISSDSQIEEFSKRNQIALFDPSTEGFLNYFKAADERRIVIELSRKTDVDFEKAFAEDMIYISRLDKIRLENAENCLKPGTGLTIVINNLKTVENQLQQARNLTQ